MNGGRSAGVDGVGVRIDGCVARGGDTANKHACQHQRQHWHQRGHSPAMYFSKSFMQAVPPFIREMLTAANPSRNGHPFPRSAHIWTLTRLQGGQGKYVYSQL